jgi:alkylation response protein AidB-like acyl-CoA dehydrogenase
VPGLLRAQRRLRPGGAADARHDRGRQARRHRPEDLDFGQIAEYQELLVRTDPDAPKHKGITWVICPMDAPGIDIRPIKTLAGNADFCEVFYDNVRIPLANVVGKLNDGWRVAMATLSFERGTAFMSEQVRQSARMEELIAVARSVPGPNGAARAIDDDELARRLARARAEVEAMRAMTYRSLSLAARTGMPGAEASMIRLFFSELIQRIDRLAMDVIGAAGVTDFNPNGSSRNEWGEDYLTGPSPGDRAVPKSSATSFMKVLGPTR